MRTELFLRKLTFGVLFLIGYLIFPCTANCQICANPSTTVYGLTPDGMVYPITMATGATAAAVTPAYTGNAASISNAMGYNPNSGKFYYFKRNCNQAPQEFVAFDPGAMSYSVKASCPTTNEMHCGCVTNSGLGYYGLDVNANLYYYNIWANTWTTIGNVFKDQFNNNVTPVLSSHNSGDLAIDGNGNLWILCSSFGEYGLYELNGPLPTTPQLQMTLRRVIVPTTATPSGDAFAGVAFNTTGQIILSTYFTNRLYRLENNFSLTFLGTMSVAQVGNDLTSCVYPLGVLSVRWESFTASISSSKNVLLNWSVSSESNHSVYYVEHSADGRNWSSLCTLQSDADMNSVAKLSYTHQQPGIGTHQYRIKTVGTSGIPDYSDIKAVVINNGDNTAIWPNPVKDIVHVQTAWPLQASLVQVFDQAGNLVKKEILSPSDNTIDLKNLERGVYIIHINGEDQKTFTQKLIKQ